MSHWIWKVLAFVVSVAVTAGVALWVYKKQSYKALSYQVLSTSPLVPLQARGFADLRLLKGDKPIERPFLATIRFLNSGELELRAADFEVALTVRIVGFGGLEKLPGGKIDRSLSIFQIPYKGVADFAPQVLDIRISSTAPERLPVEVTFEGSRLQIKPLLLNRGDEFTLDVLINGDVRGVEVSGRIAGVKQIESLEPAVQSLIDASAKRGKDLLGWAFVSLLLGVLAASAGSGAVPNRNSAPKANSPYRD